MSSRLRPGVLALVSDGCRLYRDDGVGWDKRPKVRCDGRPSIDGAESSSLMRARTRAMECVEFRNEHCRHVTMTGMRSKKPPACLRHVEDLFGAEDGGSGMCPQSAEASSTHSALSELRFTVLMTVTMLGAGEGRIIF